MKKQWRLVVLSAAVLVVLLAVWLVATLLKPDSTPSPTTTQAAVAAVYESAPENISRVEFKSEKGSIVLLPLESKDSEGKVTYVWDVADSAPFPMNKSKLDGLAEIAVKVSANAEIATGVADLTPYGLDKPAATMTVTLKSGGQTVVLFGNEIISGSYDYVSQQGSGRICTVSSFTCDKAKQTLIDLVDGSKVVGITYDDLTGLAFERARDQLRIAMDLKRVGEAGSESAYLECTVTEPVKRAGSSENLNNLAKQSSAVSASEFVELNPPDLAKYGLNKPQYTFRLQSQDKTVTLKLGNKSGDRFYASSDAFPAVFLVNASNFTIIDVPLIEMLDRFVNLQSIWEVEKIEADIFGAKFSTEITMGKDEQAEDETVIFKVDGQDAKIFSEKGSSLFSKFYQRLISVYIDGLDTTAQPVNSHEARLAFYLRANQENGEPARVKVIEFTRRDDYTYYVFIDDVYTGFYVDGGETFTETKSDDEGILIAYKKIKYAIDHAVDGVFDTSKGYQIG